MINKAILIILLISFTGCTMSPQETCEFNNGIKSMIPNRSLDDCSDHHFKWKEKRDKGCKYKIPNQFKVIDKNSPFYNCKGIVNNYPFLSEQLEWYYLFGTGYIKCGKSRSYVVGVIFKENQLRPINNE